MKKKALMLGSLPYSREILYSSKEFIIISIEL